MADRIAKDTIAPMVPKPNTMEQRMLAAMRPAGLDQAPARWQQQKSAATRLRLLEAAVDCLAGGGYGGLTTAQVAEMAGVSRGAMAHYFATRLDLVTALIEHIFYQRMRLFLDDYLDSLARRGEALLIEVASEAHWRSVETREYAAYVQLVAAARSDRELSAVFEPSARRFDEVWITEMIEAFPQWRDQWEAMKLGNDFVTAAHMGLLLQGPVIGPQRLGEVRQLIERVVRSLYQD
ncbi:MAG: TetR/AcrR family transcriptional regulator [Novosphingobium sp.]